EGHVHGHKSEIVRDFGPKIAVLTAPITCATMHQSRQLWLGFSEIFIPNSPDICAPATKVRTMQGCTSAVVEDTSLHPNQLRERRRFAPFSLVRVRNVACRGSVVVARHFNPFPTTSGGHSYEEELYPA
ncbi:MAG TPA: hypothetical protein P5148_10230, partial [Anaerolineae bacterium]|nr:hypothetical protein [Anaerolineae bacterium]